MAEVRPAALVTGASRRQGIAAAIALGLARDSWDVATTFWEDCARVVRFLCSPDGQWVNGQIVHSNGGLSSRLW